MSQTEPESEQIRALLRRTVRDALDSDVQRIEPIAGQLGLRRFLRVWLGGGRGDSPRSVIARVDVAEDPAGRPQGLAPEPPLEPVRRFLEERGLPVPIRYGGAEGLELLEDLGSVSLAQAAARCDRDERSQLYAQACDLVPRLQGLTDPGGAVAAFARPVAAFARRLDASLFEYKAELFVRWSLPERGRPATVGEEQVVRDAFARIARIAASAPALFAHRDLQSHNLFVTSAGRIVMIDLQGAFLAPPEYDLVCLLRDSYIELTDREVREQIERIRPQLPDAPESEVFSHRFDLLTLTRKGKDHARFVYFARERGDRRFLRYVPATVRALRSAAARAAQLEPWLMPLADLIHSLPETPCAQ